MKRGQSVVNIAAGILLALVIYWLYVNVAIQIPTGPQPTPPLYIDTIGKLHSSCVENKTAKIVTCEFQDDSKTIDGAHLVVRRMEQFNWTTVCDRNCSGTKGTLICSLGDEVEGRMFDYKLYVLRDEPGVVFESSCS